MQYCCFIILLCGIFNERYETYFSCVPSVAEGRGTGCKLDNSYWNGQRDQETSQFAHYPSHVLQSLSL
jgi:hypothetical protein